jgi:hypothetical protein
MSTPTAWIAVHSQLTARREAAAAGLEAHGFAPVVGDAKPTRFCAGDVLVIWNRYGHRDGWAREMERAGGRVFVMENGYVPYPSGVDTLALAEGHHTGAGWWAVGGPERWAGWGVEIQPWQDMPPPWPVIIAPQRGIGPDGVAMPRGWADRTALMCRRHTTREVRVRPHPGRHAPAVPLAEDLAVAGVVVVWSSRVGLEALLAGVPVVSLSPHWIGRTAAWPDLAELDAPPFPTAARLAMFERLAWAQWTIEEIANGCAFAGLLRRQG